LGDTYERGAARRLIWPKTASRYQTARKKRGIKPMEWRPIHRIGFSLMGPMFIAMCALALLRGKTHYENYWGGPVFAPFAIFIGLLFLVGVVTHWRKGN
jgi:hypothetical protein